MKKKETGFTIMELMVATAIFGILCAVAVPNMIGSLPGHRLRSAAGDVRSNLQLAKLRAVKENRFYAVAFDKNSDTYRVVNCGPDNRYNTSDDATVKTVDLNEYGSGVSYGHGAATSGVSGASFGDEITFPTDPLSSVDNMAMFSPTGLASHVSGSFCVGYVYLANNRRETIAVGANSIAGNITSKSWVGGGWK